MKDKQKWLHERVAIFVLWLGVGGIVITSLLKILHWQNMWKFPAEVFFILSGIYAWSTIWKVSIREEPHSTVDIFFLIILLAMLIQLGWIELAPEVEYWAYILKNGLMIVGGIGIWMQNIRLFSLKHWLCGTILFAHALSLLDHIGLVPIPFLLTVGLLLHFLLYVLLTMILHRAWLTPIEPLKEMDHLIDEIGKKN